MVFRREKIDTLLKFEKKEKIHLQMKHFIIQKLCLMLVLDSNKQRSVCGIVGNALHCWQKAAHGGPFEDDHATFC